MKHSYKKASAVCISLIVVIMIGLFSATAVYAKWSFGVMTDNHFGLLKDQAGQDPEASVVNQIDSQFIARGVKFVIDVGDQINGFGNLAVPAALAQQLYDAGIGYFPMRGNHEAVTPDNIQNFLANFPQTQGLSNTFGAANFSSPSIANDSLKGLSYSFDFNADGGSARIVIIDEWAMPSRKTIIDGLGYGYPYGYTVGEQQDWISSRLDKKVRKTAHAFVFSHHNLMPEYHFDCLFTGYADYNPEMQNAFFASLVNNNVKYYISGHEHLYNRSIVASPDGNNHVMDIICAPVGCKVLAPKDPASANFHDQKSRQTQLSQELNNIGFYIFTIDGPLVTAEYFSDATGNFKGDKLWPDGSGSLITPKFNFVKKETWGYGLNGKEFLIAQGEAYGDIVDNFEGVTARISSGYNQCNGADMWGRPFTKLVTTGWSRSDACDLFSNKIFTLWGMADFGANQTDIYALQLTNKFGPFFCGYNAFGIICTRDEQGNWVNAVDKNRGGVKRYVRGVGKAEYGLGTYGVDPFTRTAWAVLNYNGDFAIVSGIEEEPRFPCPRHR